MQCPLDGATLHLAERHGIEIDYCPTCRGVWLDRGELDKIVERADTPSPVPARARAGERPYRDDDDWDDRWRGDHRPKRKKGFLGELFEFGD